MFRKKKRIQINTERLLLRPFVLPDAPAVKELAGDYAIADTTMHIPHPYEEGMAEDWITGHQRLFEEGGMIIYAIVLKSENRLIGAVHLAVNTRFNHAELGYWIGKPYWNRGYGTEAARAMMEYGFSYCNFHKIIAVHLARNPASGRIMEKLGMQLEGTFKEHFLKWGRYEDVKMYGILKSEWESSSRK